MNDWSEGDGGYGVAPETVRADVDRDTLDVLARLELDPDLVRSVEAFMAPSPDGTKVWSPDVVPWLPGYRLARHLRRTTEQMRLRPVMYFGGTEEAKAEACDRHLAVLQSIANALEQRRKAGDTDLDDARDAMLEQWKLVSRYWPESRTYDAQAILVLEGLETKPRSDLPLGGSYDAGGVQVLGGLERLARRRPQGAVLDEPDQDKADD